MWQPQRIYNQFLLRTPVFLSGSGSAQGLYNYPGARVAIIHGSSLKEADKELFLSTFKKKEIHFIHRSWKGEPDIDGLSATIHELESFCPELIIAFRGGSVIDGVKLCRFFYEFPYFQMDNFKFEEAVFKTKFIVIPTTVGSGSEVSSAAVYIDKGRRRKEMLVMHDLQPDVVVYDEEYVRYTPKELLCTSVLDAAAHILEGYVSNIDNSMADIMAEEGLFLIREEMDKLKKGSAEGIDFGRLQYAGYLGGVVQNYCIVGAAHAVAHQMAEYGYSHGEAVSLLLPAVICMNEKDRTSKRKYMTIAKRAGFSSVHAMTEYMRDLMFEAGLENQITAFKEKLAECQKDQMFFENVRNDKGGKGNPIPITQGYLDNLIRSI